MQNGLLHADAQAALHKLLLLHDTGDIANSLFDIMKTSLFCRDDSSMDAEDLDKIEVLVNLYDIFRLQHERSRDPLPPMSDN